MMTFSGQFKVVNSVNLMAFPDPLPPNKSASESHSAGSVYIVLWLLAGIVLLY